MYSGAPPRPKQNLRDRNYVPQYRANGTGRDLMSFWPRINVMPHTARVYHAIKPINSKRSVDFLILQFHAHLVLGEILYLEKKSSEKPVNFRPTQTPWVSTSTSTPLTLSTLKVHASNCKYNLGIKVGNIYFDCKSVHYKLKNNCDLFLYVFSMKVSGVAVV